MVGVRGSLSEPSGLVNLPVSGEWDHPVAADPDHIERWSRGRHPTHRSRRIAVMADEPAVRFLRGVLTLLRSQPWERDHFATIRDRAARDEARARFATILSPELVGGTDRDT